MSPLEQHEAFEKSVRTGRLGSSLNLSRSADGYIDPLTNGIWTLWLEAREHLIVCLPHPWDSVMGIGERQGYKNAVYDCRKILENHGFKVEVPPTTDIAKSIEAENNTLNA